LLDAYDVPIAEQHEVVVDRSPIRGKPVGTLFSPVTRPSPTATPAPGTGLIRCEAQTLSLRLSVAPN